MAMQAPPLPSLKLKVQSMARAGPFPVQEDKAWMTFLQQSLLADGTVHRPLPWMKHRDIHLEGKLHGATLRDLLWYPLMSILVTNATATALPNRVTRSVVGDQLHPGSSIGGSSTFAAC